MRCDELTQHRGELAQLIGKQIQTLAKQTCDNLAPAEMHGARRKRMDELYDAVHNLDFVV